MNVLLDSSILRRYLSLKGAQIELLVDYLDKTDSRAVLTSLVLEEVKQLYRNELVDRLNRYKDSVNSLRGIQTSLKLPELAQVDIDAQVEQYVKNLHAQLGIEPGDAVGFKNEYLTDLVTRAVQKKKPLDEKGHQFRDGILWLTLLDYAAGDKDRMLAFISANTKDFADDSRIGLHPDLLREAEGRGVSVKYFDSLDSFLKAQAALIDFVTFDWLEEHLDDDEIEGQVLPLVRDRAIDRLMDDLVLVGRDRRVGAYEPTGGVETFIDEYYVYEKKDGTLVLNASLELNIEYSIAIERDADPDRPNWEYLPMRNAEGSLDTDLVMFPEYSVERTGRREHTSVPIRARFTASIVKKELKEYQLVDWDWG